MEHHQDLIRNRDSKSCGKLLVAHILWPRDLHFEIMIAAAERTDLIVAAVDCALADIGCIGAGDAAVLLSQFEVFFPGVLVFDAPAGALLDEVAKITAR